MTMLEPLLAWSDISLDLSSVLSVDSPWWAWWDGSLPPGSNVSNTTGRAELVWVLRRSAIWGTVHAVEPIERQQAEIVTKDACKVAIGGEIARGPTVHESGAVKLRSEDKTMTGMSVHRWVRRQMLGRVIRSAQECAAGGQ